MKTNLAHVDGATSTATQPLLELHDIRKRFGGTVALAGVTLSVAPGEVHGLIGENGAGKSTLIKVLCGIVKPDSGAITLAGDAYAPHTPRDAKARGLQVVHQEFNLLPFLSVAENIFIEHLPRNALGVVKRRDMHTRVRAALDAIGLKDIDVRWPVERLGIAHRQLVEVARALMTESRVLILDEPTATLTSRETERLFAIIDDLRRRGVSIIFVSHHLDEVFRLCDRVTVLRNGETVTSRRIGETTQDELVRAMVGQQLQKEMTHSTASSARSDTVLSLVNFRHAQSPHVDGISFDLHKGEILGIAGLVGSGRTELLRAIFAAEPPLSGTLMRDGKPVALRSPRDAIRAGIGFVTEDRKEEGLILSMPIAANVTMASLSDVSRGGLLDQRAENALTEKLGADLKLKYGGPGKNAATLSGGNQQKVVLAKWLARKPEILLLDEPTRGVDVGAKAEIYALIRRLAERGLALLVVSSELPELMTLCDRIMVMSQHRIVGSLPRAEFSEEKILTYAYQGEKRQTGH
ncbi:putative ribose transport system, substrate-binding protein [Sinorhizobium fredii NGR234]|uniref:Ribose transport system, substrate-binding protein n=1 Tax=Sinorhizobium fredii (strain NBRC 101917 / NGR234) TaxID=394 RepID=C3MDI2_SINFN|nr:sugar ABC transporter ATP-binding protein [Sinorhizobium fredii]ACP25501.1 putative ribose transport system, substrate-binding protein [Sinorhizobium fredii NGR234]